MTNFITELAKRRTFAIISHPDAGKTTITEKLLLWGNAIQLAGSVKGKRGPHAKSDWMTMEQERGISVTSSVMQFPYRGRVVNLLDTPGHQDFSEDTYRTLVAADSGVTLTVAGPERLRSGELFEMLFTIETEREIKDAVLSVDADVWHDITINTMIPQPTEEGFDDGAFEFHYGALPPGTRLLVKVDGQVNPVYPPGPNQGAIEITDGLATLVSIDYRLMVLP